MIREMEQADIEAVMQIWLDTNIEAHSFIPEQYWQEHFAAVKKMLPKAEV